MTPKPERTHPPGTVPPAPQPKPEIELPPPDGSGESAMAGFHGGHLLAIFIALGLTGGVTVFADRTDERASKWLREKLPAKPLPLVQALDTAQAKLDEVPGVPPRFVSGQPKPTDRKPIVRGKDTAKDKKAEKKAEASPPKAANKSKDKAAAVKQEQQQQQQQQQQQKEQKDQEKPTPQEPQQEQPSTPAEAPLAPAEGGAGEPAAEALALVEPAPPLPAVEEPEAPVVVAKPANTPKTAVEQLHDELDKLQRMHRNLRATSIEQLVTASDANYAKMQKDLDAKLKMNTADMDAAQLRKHIIQLAAELEMGSKWEAQRQRELLQLVEDDYEAKFMQQLDEAQERSNFVLDGEKKRVARATADNLKADLDELEQDAQMQRRVALDQQDAIFAKRRAEAVQDAVAEHREQLSQSMQLALGKEKEELTTITDINRDVLKSMEIKVKDYLQAYVDEATWDRSSDETKYLTVAALALCEAMKGSDPVDRQVKFVASLPAADDLVAATTSSLLALKASEGFPTTDQLRATFVRVRNVSRTEHYVPDGLSGATGRMVGWARAALPKMQPAGPPQGNSTEAVLARMDMHLQDNDLAGAVRECTLLEGRAAEPFKDWVADATSRLAAEQALSALITHASLLHARLGD